MRRDSSLTSQNAKKRFYFAKIGEVQGTGSAGILAGVSKCGEGISPAGMPALPVWRPLMDPMRDWSAELQLRAVTLDEGLDNARESWEQRGNQAVVVFGLENKTALVTGGASGIGAAIAEIFAQAGAKVWIADCDGTNGAKVAAKIGGQFLQLDVSLAEECASAAVRTGPLDVLANVAGIGHVGTLINTTAVDCDRLYAVNVRGIFNCCKAFAPVMLERKRGSVINMASVAGIVAVRDRLAYTMTKFAVVGLTKALALDHSHTGVRFNCICPGRVETPFVLARLREYPDPEQACRDMAATQLTGRMARPGEIAAAALYLAADESAVVTGSALMIDGGWTAGK